MILDLLSTKTRPTAISKSIAIQAKAFNISEII